MRTHSINNQWLALGAVRAVWASLRVVVGLVAFGLTLIGCGYAHQPLYPEDVATVAVPIFGNRSFYQGVERDLTEALIKEIEWRTPYKVTAPNDADTIINGTVLSVRQTRLSRTSAGDVPQEMELRLTVDFEWKNLQTGRTIRQRKGYRAVGRYLPVRQVGEPYQVAQHHAVQQLAQDMVMIMAGDW